MDAMQNIATTITGGSVANTGSNRGKRIFLLIGFVIVASALVGTLVYYFTQVEKLTLTRKVGKQITFTSNS